ncbi:hypothetical protein HMI56_006548 [Coelomomyces lativittatus]|nr:hypothetical protein HMI56_006548 [Coelomomyces lativittatus]
MDEIKQNLASFKEDASGDTQLSDSLSRTNSIGSDPFPNTPPRNSGVGRYITGFDANF